MSTNYYAQFDVCPHCGRPESSIHLGKSSGGWRFSIEVHEEYYKDWEGFKAFVVGHGAIIKDEYGATIEPTDFIQFIFDKASGDSHAQFRTTGGGKIMLDGPADFCFYEFS